MASDRPATLLVFSDDWGRHPSSCQHLIGRLLGKYEVLWVNTIGMRPPALDRTTLVRGLGKIRQWLRPGRAEQGGRAAAPDSRSSTSTEFNPRVISPLMWPTFGPVLGRRLNHRLLCRRLEAELAAAPRPVVAVTTIPVVADLLGELPVDRWVYYCVDDFSKWPALDQAIIDQMEGQLVRQADVLVAVSEKLQERLAGWRRESHLLTHGVDLAHWTDPTLAMPEALERLQRPLVMFWGLIDWQMDVQFLECLAAEMDQGTIVLVGPTDNPPAALWNVPRVVHMPQVPYTELPRLAQAANVLIMPYSDSPGLQESQPLKLKEYLATGKPAVVRDLPANRAWADALDLADSPEAFAAIVCRRLAEGLPAAQAEARRRLQQESWDDKAREFERVAILGPRSGDTGEGRHVG
ncbi:MAG: glycosyltransferase [Pirellulales bacterium]|nr:glycosyltransferase [Pirellulales bacterium]